MRRLQPLRRQDHHGCGSTRRTDRRSDGCLPQQRLGSPQLSPKVAVSYGHCTAQRSVQCKRKGRVPLQRGTASNRTSRRVGTSPSGLCTWQHAEGMWRIQAHLPVPMFVTGGRHVTAWQREASSVCALLSRLGAREEPAVGIDKRSRHGDRHWMDDRSSVAIAADRAAVLARGLAPIAVRGRRCNCGCGP
jgi:hypothetical protein